MLTKHWLENYRFQFIRIFFIADEIPVNAQPVHVMVAKHFSFSHDWHIVFSMTGDNTGIATDATIHVYAHAPL